jgi:DNA polymerase
MLKVIAEEAKNCIRCSLHTERKNVVFGEGSVPADLMFVGEAPGEWEDALGKPFVGRAGLLLNNVIKAFKYKREEVYIANIIKCRPPGNRDPIPPEIEACKTFINKQIESVSPKVIVTLGRVASQILLQNDIPISKQRGEWMSYNNTAVMPTFHPAYILRNPEAKTFLQKDMTRVRDKLYV